MDRAEKGEAYFRQGYNCAQAVVLAFEDLLGADRDTLLKVSAPFGGGIGRMHEVCGAVSGAMIVLGMLFYDPGKASGRENMVLYAREQAVAAGFKERNGSLICRELLSGAGGAGKRPCRLLVSDAVRLVENYLREEGSIDPDESASGAADGSEEGEGT